MARVGWQNNNLPSFKLMTVFRWIHLPQTADVFIIIWVIRVELLPHQQILTITTSLHMFLADKMRMPLVPTVKSRLT